MPAIVHVVDDDPGYRSAIARLLRQSGYEVVLYESAAQLFELSEDPRLGCILLDLKMPDLSGLQLQDRLSQRGFTLPIIFLTGYGDILTSVQAIKAGAEDFLTKPVAKETLIAAIEGAIGRCREAQAQRDRLTSLRALAVKLTPREGAVFVRVANGKLSKQIAFELGTTVRTIKAHRQSVMHKLDAKSLLELVSVAGRLGLLDAPEKRQVGL